MARTDAARGTSFNSSADDAALLEATAAKQGADEAAARANAAADALEDADLATLVAETVAARDAAAAVASPVAEAQAGSGGAFDNLLAQARAGVRGVELPADTDLAAVGIIRIRHDAGDDHLALGDADGATQWQFRNTSGGTPDGRVVLSGQGGRPDGAAYVAWSEIAAGLATPGAGADFVELAPSALVGGEADPVAADRAREAGAGLAALVAEVGTLEASLDDVVADVAESATAISDLEAAAAVGSPIARTAFKAAAPNPVEVDLLRAARRYVIALRLPDGLDPADYVVSAIRTDGRLRLEVSRADDDTVVYVYQPAGSVPSPLPAGRVELARQGDGQAPKASAVVHWAGLVGDPDLGGRNLGHVNYPGVPLTERARHDAATLLAEIEARVLTQASDLVPWLRAGLDIEVVNSYTAAGEIANASARWPDGTGAALGVTYHAPGKPSRIAANYGPLSKRAVWEIDYDASGRVTRSETLLEDIA